MDISRNDKIHETFLGLLELLRDTKGEERSPRARALAIVITLTEQAYAYFCTFGE